MGHFARMQTSKWHAIKNECKIGNDHQKLSFILCVQLNLGMKLLAVAFVWFLMQTCTEHQGGKFRPKNAIFYTVFYHKIGILLSKYFKEHTTI